MTLRRKVIYTALNFEKLCDARAVSPRRDPYWRPIKYALVPPLGLATLAANQVLILSGCRDYRGHLNSDTGHPEGGGRYEREAIV